MPNDEHEEEILADAPRKPLAHTPEETAAIIGGDIKASYLRALARKREIPALWVGKWAFLDEDIPAIIAYCRRPARHAAPAAAEPPAATRRRPPLPAPAPGPEPAMMVPREFRKQRPRPPRDGNPGGTGLGTTVPDPRLQIREAAHGLRTRVRSYLPVDPSLAD